MSTAEYAVIWIDHRQARVIQLGADKLESVEVDSPHPHQHLHHKANSSDSGHVSVDSTFLERIASILAGIGMLLITGPGTAKNELVHYLEKREPAIAARIVSVQPMDHPSEAQLIAFARKFFGANARMRTQLRRTSVDLNIGTCADFAPDDPKR